ncbi:SOUL family heme-binding protein [Arthrobacter sp. L77]|uniref:SOUL family heme-binding protein n=1 Tax=Arthrobacter sp. L77 TaxID=1496689 RepID=UPI0005BAF080|nr:heme-binding protein [Arthrobacter sp. L77]
MTEQQPYTLIDTYPGFELRAYPAHVVAEVDVDTAFDSAGNAAFRTLASYIFGANTSRRKLTMTAPVTQQASTPAGEASSEQLAMTAPVTQQRAPTGHTVAFVLPADVSFATAPVPDDPRVRVVQKPAATTAAVSFSGRGGQASFERHLQGLLAAVGKAAFVPRGEPRYARFDPPITPGVFRHNEVQIDVVGMRGEKSHP